MKLATYILAAAGIIALLAIFVIPTLGRWLGIIQPKEAVATPTPTIEATPTPTPNLQETVNELILSSPHIFSPTFNGSQLMFSAGTDNVGNAKMNFIYIFELGQQKEEKIEDIELKNDDLFEPQFNDDWIVYIDAKRSGGGDITAFNRSTKKSTVIHSLQTGLPRVRLWGNYIAWVERTGTRQDKLYLCDLRTFESVTLAVFENSPFGFSSPGMGGGTLVWANADPDQDAFEVSGGTPNGAIYSLDLTAEKPAVKVYQPRMYVHDPEVYGTLVAWSNANHAKNAELFCSVNGSSPKLIDEDILQYGAGEGFVAYTKQGKLYVYRPGDGTSKLIAPEREVCSLAGVFGNKVLWYDITDGNGRRDIIKYTEIR